MRGNTRGVSTVADVGLALLLVAGAMALLATFVDGTRPTHDPMETEYTTETVLSSTVDTTYHLERAVADANDITDTADIYEETAYERGDLRRVSHGPVAAQVADIAVTNVTFHDESGADGRLSRGAHEHRERLDEMVQSRLVNSSFETHVTAVWEPFGGESWITGTAEIGESPPAYEDVSSTTVTVPSDIPAARERALDAVSDPADFDVVANVVAAAIIDGYFPEIESQRALEGTGVERDLVVARYERMVDLLDPDPDLLGPDESFAEHLTRTGANATRANQILTEALAQQFEQFLEPNPAAPPDSQPLGDAASAAAQITTGDVTVTIRTWD